MRTFMALLGGAMIGAAAALLYAPETGSATRARIKDQGAKAWHDMTDFAESKGRHLRNKMQGMSHMAQDAIGKGTEVIESAGDRLQATLSTMDTTPARMAAAMDEEEDETLV
jgi:gas vesicle protein